MVPMLNKESEMSLKNRLIHHFISAQERRAQLYVNGALSRLDDETLASLGLVPNEVRRRPSRSMM